MRLQTRLQMPKVGLILGSFDHLKQIPNVTVTFVQALFVLTTFSHIMYSSAVADKILTQFFGGLNFFTPKFFLTQKCFRPKILLEQIS